MGGKIIKTYIFVVLAAIALAGCWDATDINKKDIAVAIAVHKTNGEFVFYAEIADLTSTQNGGDEKNGKGSSAKYSVLKGKGKTYVKSRFDLDSKLDRPLFLGTVRVLILTTGLTKDGIEEYMYRMREVADYRKTGSIITTSQDPYDLLNVETENEAASGNAIEDTLHHLVVQGNAVDISTSEVFEYIAGDQSFVLPNVDIRSEEIALTGYTVIDNAKYKGFIPYEETKGLVFFLNRDAQWSYVVPFGEHRATVEVRLDDKKIKPHYNGKEIRFDVEFSFKSTVLYLDTNEKFDEKDQEKVKNNLQKILLDDLFNTVYKSQSVNKCDYLRFDEAFRIAFPKEYKQMKWRKVYLNAHFQIKVKTKLDPGGSMQYNPQAKP